MGCNVGPFAERGPAIELAQGAEAAGFESIWTFEHVVVPGGYESAYPYSGDGRMPGDGANAITDPLTWLAFIGAVTTTIKLGTGILILPEHNPVLLAKEAATVDRLTDGRLLLGIGVGWLKEEFEALGVPWERRTARTEEYAAAMRPLWTEEEPSFEGEFVSYVRARCSPQPVQAGGVPIIVGGHSDAAARRAGRIGDGFFPVAGPDRVAELVALVHASALEAGRDPSAIEITSMGPGPGHPLVERYAEAGVTRLVCSLPTYDPTTVAARLAEMGEAIG
jgi:probable F420-dependent oxidoreductase